MFEVIILVLSIILALIGVLAFLGSLSRGFDMDMVIFLLIFFAPLVWAIYRLKQRKSAEEQQRTEAEKKRLAEEKAEKERKLAEEEAERTRRQAEELKRKTEGSAKRFNEIKQQICGRMFDILENNNVNMEKHSILIFAGYISEESCNDLWIYLWSKYILNNLEDEYKSALDKINSEYTTEVYDYNNAPRIIEEFESKNNELLEQKEYMNQYILNFKRERIKNPKGSSHYDLLISQGEQIIQQLDDALADSIKLIEEEKALLRNTAPYIKYNKKSNETTAYYENQLKCIKNAFVLLRSEFKEDESLDFDEIMSRLKYTYKDWIFKNASNHDEIFSIAEGKYIYIGDTYPKNNGHNSKPLYTWDGNRMYNGDGSEKNVLYTLKGRYVYKGEDTEGTAVYTLV